MKKVFLFILVVCSSNLSFAQNDSLLYIKSTTKDGRLNTHRNIINNSIVKNLSLPLNEETEENWEDAFYAMALINYKNLWIDNRIKIAFDSIQYRSIEFQRSLIEMIYTVYPVDFKNEVYSINENTNNAKVFAMSAEYLWQQDKDNLILIPDANTFIGDSIKNNALIKMLQQQASKKSIQNVAELIKKMTNPVYLPGNTIVYSFQRSNRNYPGLVIVRNGKGNIVTNFDGTLFSTPQLARSVSNMSSYLTNGNTPQGVFRMNGFDVSKSIAIGPTTNLQLMMPFETTPQFFLKDSTITDTVWTEDLYKRILPEGWKDEMKLYQTFYASKIGRTEIIAHGTTVDPEYYRTQPFYPYTPTQGCLCTKEIWDGKRRVSDQQKLADAVKKTGKGDGYLIVIEIDDQQKPVSASEIFSLMGLSKNNFSH